MKKLFLILLAVGLLVVMAVGCGGSDVPAQDNEPIAEPVPLPDVVEDLPGDVIEGDGSDIIFDGELLLPDMGVDVNPEDCLPEYLFSTGVIESIEDVDGATHVWIVDDEDSKTVLVLNDETIFPFSDSFEVGDTVTGWRLASGIAPSIYPPQYFIAVFAAGVPDDVSVKVDRFTKWEDHQEDYMLSQDGELAFKVDEDTVILTQDGDDYVGFSTEMPRRIVVIYGPASRMMPATTTASELIVLFEGIVPLM